jgi:hypothetical protein
VAGGGGHVADQPSPLSCACVLAGVAVKADGQLVEVQQPAVAVHRRLAAPVGRSTQPWLSVALRRMPHPSGALLTPPGIWQAGTGNYRKRK